MTLIQILVLAMVQGLTEFLPVSSSAHLILGGHLFGWTDQGLVFDVATHLGTLFAALFYFRHDITGMVVACVRQPKTKLQTTQRRLACNLILASVPVILIAALLHSWIETHLRDLRVIAVSTLLFGVLLWWADARAKSDRGLPDMRLRPALAIGLAQVCALIPGASRSGVTITMARAMGFNAEAAARFSFLLSIPVIAAAGGYGLLKMAQGQGSMDWAGFSLAVLVSAFAGWLCIAAFLALLRRVGLLPFIIYRLVLGLVLLFLLW